MTFTPLKNSVIAHNFYVLVIFKSKRYNVQLGLPKFYPVPLTDMDHNYQGKEFASAEMNMNFIQTYFCNDESSIERMIYIGLVTADEKWT